MSDIVPGKKYTRQQLKSLVRDEKDAAKLAFQGFVLQHDLLDDTYMLVHWTKSASGAERGQSNRPFGAPRMAHDPYAFSPPPPIVKRTPAQRREALAKRWFEHCRRAGGIPGLSDEQVTELLGENWKNGDREITYADVERLAQVMLERAEAKHEEKLSHQVTRHET